LCTAFLPKVWTSFTAGFQKAWNTAINWTTKRLIELQGLFDSSLDVDVAKQMADGGTQHITQSLATIQKYAAAGTAPDFGGAIGVTHDSVEGVDITVPM
jgi:hypothetical protein